MHIHVPNSGSYTRSRFIVQLTVLLSSSYFYRICKPDDGSHEPKHVAPCSPLFLINNSNLYFIVCDWRLIVPVYTEWMMNELLLYMFRVLTHAVDRLATVSSRREWQYHILHVYNCILLKMSTYGSKHVEKQYNINKLMNNNRCIKLVINI